MKERWIKRYANRKLYDVENSRYVSLHDLAIIIRKGDSIRVTDKDGGEDYTAQTLRLIILEQSKQSDESSVSQLHHWIRQGGSFLDERLDDMRVGMEDWIKERKAQIRNVLNRDDFDKLKKKVEELEKKIEELDA